MPIENNSPKPSSTAGVSSLSTARPEGAGRLDADKLAADAGAIKNEAKRVAGDIANQAKGQIDTVVGEVKERAADVAEHAKDMAGTQKDMIADQIGGIADAAERVAQDLEGDSAPGASYVRMVADHAQKLSGSIRDKDVEELLGMAEDFGRKQPAAFLGAAALLGFSASRFLTASAKRRQQPTPQTPTMSQSSGFQSPAASTSPSQSEPAASRYNAGGIR